jgi:ferredoxin
MRIVINEDLCQGHLRCVALAPELFEVNSLGEGRPRAPGTVSTAQWDAAYRAQRSCPEEAIELIDVEDGWVPEPASRAGPSRH